MIPLRKMGIIDVKRRKFVLLDAKKLLIYFATKRSIAKDRIYETRYDASVIEIEKLMPSGITYAAYSAFRLMFKNPPADYSEFYVYANPETLKEIKDRKYRTLLAEC